MEDIPFLLITEQDYQIAVKKKERDWGKDRSIQMTLINNLIDFFLNVVKII